MCVCIFSGQYLHADMVFVFFVQDPQNKKMIVCDEKLKNIFGGRERVGFLEVAGLINPHFLQ